MKQIIRIFPAIIIFFYACGEGGNKETPKVYKTSAEAESPMISDLIPGYYDADSLCVIRYDDPMGDSLRYSRYFSYRMISDSDSVRTFLQSMDGVYLPQDTLRSCRSEGKIYIMRKDEILKTVYYSKLSGGCSYYYFIMDGRFYYGGG